MNQACFGFIPSKFPKLKRQYNLFTIELQKHSVFYCYIEKKQFYYLFHSCKLQTVKLLLSGCICLSISMLTSIPKMRYPENE